MPGEVFLNIQNVVDKLLPEAIEKGLTEIGKLIKEDATDKCPVDDGQLRASIDFVVDMKESSVSIGSNLEYAPYVHQGTGIYAVDGDGRQTPWRYQDAKGDWHTTKGQKPQPFLQQAVDENREKLPNVFKNLLIRQESE